MIDSGRPNPFRSASLRQTRRASGWSFVRLSDMRNASASGSEFVYREGRHTVREIERREPPAREVVLLLTNGIMVTAAGEADMKALKALAAGLPIDAAEALVRPAK